MKKLFISCLLASCLVSATAYAKDVYYKTFTDSTSGRTIEYFDLAGNDVERLYFTQSYWTQNSDAFAVSDYDESKMYLYNVASHTVTPLHGDDIQSNDVAITPNNIMFLRSFSTDAKTGGIFMKDLNSTQQTTSTEVYAEVNSSGTALSGTLLLDSTEQNSESHYDKNILFSGKVGKSAVDGKHYLYNNKYDTTTTWQTWANAFYFKIPDSFLYNTNYEKVEIEVLYYAPSSGQTLKLITKNTSNADTDYGAEALETGKWATKVFTIYKNDGKNVKFANSLNSCDFRLQGNAQTYINKVTVRKVSDSLKCISTNELGGYQLHATNDGKFLSITVHGRVSIYDVEKNKWGSMYKGFSSPSGSYADHVMINPVYNNLVLFAHDSSDSIDVFDRMWIFDRNTASFYNLFKQYKNLDNTYTGEAVGHESWTADGESIVAVKYSKSTNIGKNGIIRFNRYGTEREYINDDYKYWHCSPSSDGRWIVADTEIDKSKNTKIVLIDTKTGKSYVVAEQQAGWNDPWQPHAQFSRDGKKVTFSMIYRKVNDENVLGVGIVDVSDLVNSDSYTEKKLKDTNKQQGFRVSPVQIVFGANSKIVAMADIENLDGKARSMTMYLASFDKDGKMLSISKKEMNSSENEKIKTELTWTENSDHLKCFLWDDNDKPISLSPSMVEKLRVARVGSNEAVITWQTGANLNNLFEIYRNGTLVYVTSDTMYRDVNLSADTEYTYEVKPIEGTVNYLAINNQCIAVRPAFSYFGGATRNYGLTFLENNSCSTDSYTVEDVIGGEACRKAIKVTKGTVIDGNTRYGSDYTGMFYFTCNRNIVSSDTRSVKIGIRYFDNGTNGISLDYNAEDGSSGKSVQIATRTNTNTWKTATVTITDAKFVANQALSYSDFRIRGGSDTYINNVWAMPTGSTKIKWATPAHNSAAIVSKIGVKCKTIPAILTSKIGAPITESGMHFLLNEGTTTTDSYTEASTKEGVACRKSTAQKVDSKEKIGMFYFAVDKNCISKDDNKVKISVKYYDYNEDGADLYIDYNATDGSSGKSVKLADVGSSIVDKYKKEWKTASVTLSDAMFVGNKDLTYCDFRIRPTQPGVYISEVSVENLSTKSFSPYQYVEWNTANSMGLTKVQGGTVEGDYIHLVNYNDWIHFDVDDNYQHSSQMNIAWVDITYWDKGTSDIYVEYNTNDPTATSAQKSHKRSENDITCHDTGELLTKRIEIVDAGFQNISGYDFKIGTSGQAYIQNVKMMGY